MSHEATTWAIRQRGLSPAAKLVLWHLADRFHPDHGCFPSQKTLASDCEMSRASLNTQLDALEMAGLIARESRVDEATKRQLSTRYRLACERGFKPVEMESSGAETMPEGSSAEAAENPCPNSGHGSEKADPCPENTESRVQLFGHGYKDEPVIEPVRDKKNGASADGQAQGQAGAGGAEAPGAPEFEAFWAAWLAAVPSAVSDSRPKAEQVWLALGLAERRAGLEQLDRWIAASKAGRPKWIAPAGSTYLSAMMWRNLPAAPAGGAAGAPRCVKPLSRDWWSALWRRVETGQAIGFMVADACRPASVFALKPGEAEVRCSALRMADRDSGDWRDWRDWMRRMRLPQPETAAGVPVWLPPGAPPDPSRPDAAQRIFQGGEG